MVKNSPADARDVRDPGLITELGRFPGGGNSNPLQYSCLENPMGRGACWVIVRRVAKRQTRLNRHSIAQHTQQHSPGLLAALLGLCAPGAAENPPG